MPESFENQSGISTTRRAFLWVALSFFAVLAITAGWFLLYLANPGPHTDEPAVIVEIPKGSSSKQIAAMLAEKKLIHDDIRFLALVRIMGRSARLQAGEFLLHTGQRPKDLVDELSRARSVVHPVTIPEGMRIKQVAGIFAMGGWADVTAFIDAAKEQALVERYHLGPADSLEGYLFPDTYHLVKSGLTEAELVEMMVERALQVWEAVSSENQSSLSRQDVFTLASIVEKESANNSERPIIAAVFLNRLKRKMRLQSDPTVIYGLESFDGNLTRTHLKTPAPYNTYMIHGLPPGPICSPGRKSIEAVLHPAQVDYLYFVSKNDGTHHFSRTLREHNNAVRRYQRKGKKKQG